VARNVISGPEKQPDQPRLFIQEAEVRPDLAALRHFRLNPRSFIVRNGRLTVPLNAAGETARTLEVSDIMITLQFLPNDQWELDQFEARALGAKISLLGTLTNASRVGSWRLALSTNQTFRPWQYWLRQLQETGAKIRFAQPPVLRLNFHGDADVPNSLGGLLTFNLAAADTPWGNMQNALLSCILLPPDNTNKLTQARLKLTLGQFHSPASLVNQAQLTGSCRLALTNPMPSDFSCQFECAQLQTPWATGQNLKLSADIGAVKDDEPSRSANAGPALRVADRLGANLDLTAEDVRTRSLSAQHCAFRGLMTFLTTNWTPETLDGRFSLARVQTPVCSATGAEVSLDMSYVPQGGIHPTNEIPDWWTVWKPYQLSWEARFTDVRATNLEARTVSVAGHWHAPRLSIEALRADLYGGHLKASAGLEMGTRRLDASVASDFDLRQLTPLLSATAGKWLNRFSWQTPPRIDFNASAVLPAWTNREQHWKDQVLPTLTLDGSLAMGPGAYHRVQMESLMTHFSFSNSLCHLPDLTVRRPEGSLEFDILFNPGISTYRIGIRGGILPHALESILDGPASQALALFEFRQPVTVNGEVNGTLTDDSQPCALGELAASDFSFRGRHCDRFQANLEYTNGLCQLRDAQLWCDGRAIKATLVSFDSYERRIALTNVLCDLDPMIVAACISDDAAKTIAPYRFLEPPQARVDGELLLGHPLRPYLRFDLDGGPFNYWRFVVPQISATVDWAPGLVTISNLQSSFYQGRMIGDGRFDVSPYHATLLNFKVNVTNADLRLLVRDLSPKTNQLEGRLDLDLFVSSAVSTNWNSWQGHGRINLADGLIWDIPVFGIFSPVLNAVAPGLGNSRADRGKATFTITNSVIYTDDLEINTAMARLHYKGTVDFNKQVNARAEAALLQDTGVAGPIFWLAFLPFTKLFEVKVTGTLDQPKHQMLYLFPRLLMMPLHPFRTLRDLFPSEESKQKPAPTADERAPFYPRP
jgi:hypothetical protein